MDSLPYHLKKYVVEQDYSRYTSEDQAVWRYILRQLRDFLAQNAHPAYLEGLKRTGIDVDRIPHISDMSKKLEKFGWRALPVSGFIPPAAFMELQSLGFLPIASDMRSIDHLSYTPAPDIVHEAAGHAPILVDEEYAAYLKKYAQVARKAIISRQDMEQYEAIRVLSDVKENPESTQQEIHESEAKLIATNKNITKYSEAALLGRMNWWTAEYGLIGSIDRPKIFGAGLLSSVGEARTCLTAKVKKLPLSVECVDYAYDITEPQPQLFVTPDFATLGTVLEQFSERMSFRTGGLAGLRKAQEAQTVNTVEFNSGVQISGMLSKIWQSADGHPSYLSFQGPCQLSLNSSEIKNHGKSAHPQGFGTPVGKLKAESSCLSTWSDSDLQTRGIKIGAQCNLEFASGIIVNGTVTRWLRNSSGALVVLSFTDAKVAGHGQVLFEPAWGTYDMAIGSRVVSVFGGPADREKYGQVEDFEAKKVPTKKIRSEMKSAYSLYTESRELRESKLPDLNEKITRLYLEAIENPLANWLVLLELAETLTSKNLSDGSEYRDILAKLNLVALKNSHLKPVIEDGLRIVSHA